jgi:hypothetical protein
MPKKQSKKPVVDPGPSAAQRWDAQLKSAGGWLGDLVGAPESASAPHSADTYGENGHSAHPKTGGSSIFQSIGDLGRGVQQEGLSALLDPMGIIDRQDAQRDLASRFDVGGLGAGVGDGDQQNDVTSEEFQEIAKLYSDIRRGKTSLQVGPSGMQGAQTEGALWTEKALDDKESRQFQERTMEDIADILQTTSGRGLVGELANNKETTVISKAVDALGKTDTAGAAGGNYEYLNDKGRELGREGKVKYAAGETNLGDNGGEYRSDVTLFHELTHAYHGLNRSTAFGGVYDVPEQDQEIGANEYQAVGLQAYAGNKYTENAYRRDRAALTSGNRTLGGNDSDLLQRDTYLPKKN